MLSHILSLFSSSKKQNKMTSKKTINSLGLEIDFPFQPYGIQRVMMNRLTSTLINKEHSLIESPTGTGKTLVLLCSSLAWQKKSKALGKPFLSAKLKKALMLERRERLMRKPCTCGRRPNRTELDELKEAKENSKKDFDDLKKKDFSQLMSDYDDTVMEKEKKKNNNDSNKIIKIEEVDLLSDFSEEEELSAAKKMKMDLGLIETKNSKNTTTANLSTSKYFPKSQDPDDADVIIIEDDSSEAKCTGGSDECKIIKEDQEPKSKSEASKATKTSDEFGDGDEGAFCISCAAIQAEDKFAEVFGEDSADTDAFVSAKIKSKVPRIYYGTRTHKQITQVIRELNKTPYNNDLRMCILSSRERTCINDEVKDSANRNDLCQELVKNSKKENPFSKNKKSAGESCPFYKDSNSCTTIFEDINNEYDDRAWDIEEANSFGMKNTCCPYFGTRSLQGQADITFSPYNYLLDPNIRKTMDINLNNAIVIFDEAHNIEDICRDSASFLIDTKQIDDILETINIAASHYMQGSVVMDAYQFFRDKFLNLKSYLLKYSFPGPPEKGSDFLNKKILNKIELVHDLASLGLGSENLTKIKENLKALKGGEDDETSEKKSSDSDQSVLSFGQQQFFSQLCITLEFMYASSNKHLDDFRGVITKSLDRETSRPNRGYRGNQQDNHNTSADGNKHKWQFSLLCMNPGIAFEKIHSMAWSVIVASGTLSPIESLKTELGCQFTNVFEGSHVIQSERIFASIVSKGPSRVVDLNCGWQNSLKLDFQDEVGTVVRDICTTVPHGVLCFFPSYDRMENLYQRWFTKGYITDIQKAGKKLFREEKRMLPANFEKELAKYNKNAKTSGAVLFAVFRGKVSEGIDFADQAARAVITIGIPYPNVKEITVNLKREYNDVARRSKQQLMTGGDWYASQAFRALNQALGRCIRHKEDWGAIIMIDSRLNTPQNLNCISKWLRRDLLITQDYSMIRQGLEEFVKRRTYDNNEV